MLISTDDYRAQCEAFFALADNTQSAIDAQVAGLGVEQFQEWQSSIFERYDAATKGLIRELVAEIDFDEDVESEKTKAQRQVVRTYRAINDDVCQMRVFDLASVQTKIAELQAWHVEEDRKRSLQVSIEGRQFTAEQVIDVLWSGWECDNHAWLVRDNGAARLVTTDHGSARFSDRAFLEGKLAEYQDAIAKTQALLDALDN